ncbi:dynamin family protein [Alternaria alternata]|nr:dynamin family protein [Alternaria alternata]
MASSTSSESDFEGVEMSATPTVSIDPDSVTTSSLHALQSADQRKVMDIVDKLRRTGLSGIVELPQLVVCGDQSSGKSSVLEAITEIPFPRKENLCTRFATEVSKISDTAGVILMKFRSSSVALHRRPARSRSLQTSFARSRSKPSSSRSASP